MAKHANLNSLFTDIANAIRNKIGGGSIVADVFPDKINSIVTFAQGTAGGNITAGDVRKGKIGFSRGQRIVGNLVPPPAFKHEEAVLFASPDSNPYSNYSSTWTCPSTGTYRICAIGRGSISTPGYGYDSTYVQVGYHGGAGYVIRNFTAGQRFTVNVNASRSEVVGVITATAGREGDSEEGYESYGRVGTVTGTGVISFPKSTDGGLSINPPSFWAIYKSKGGGSAESFRHGGSGLFGGDGGLPGGGKGGGRGAGDGGNYFNGHDGGGGGGGYGGGGGKADWYTDGHGGSGQPGAGCIYIEKIG